MNPGPDRSQPESMAARELIPSVDRAEPLTTLEVRRDVPERPGIYAAWITEQAALRQAGIRCDPPCLLYVGRATKGEAPLRKRLERHARVPFYDLAEMLAVRGNALFPWHARVWGEHSRFRPGALCQLSEAQTMDWTWRNVSWSWRACSKERAVADENAAIKAGNPVLNRAGGGPTLPQLRVSSPRAGARWIWQVAWAALLHGDDYGFDNLPESALAEWDWNQFCVDRHGYPLPHSMWKDQGTPPPRWFPKPPPTKRLRALMAKAARDTEPSVRNAIGQGPTPVDELKLWWAAHKSAEFLREPIGIEEALEASLGMADERSAPCPARPPRPLLREKLVLLERTHSRVRK